MAKRYAIGVFNGNWKNKWKRELEDTSSRRAYIIENNKETFGDALQDLKAVDPDWEAWFDNDDNIPPFILWTDTEEINELCKRMTERAIQCQSETQGMKIP